MFRDSGQFGSFDGLDNRRAVFELLDRLGRGLGELDAAGVRARWLRRLLKHSRNGFAEAMVRITPCSAIEAYRVFTAITGVLGVPIDEAARLLEDEVRRARGAAA